MEAHLPCSRDRIHNVVRGPSAYASDLADRFASFVKLASDSEALHWTLYSLALRHTNRIYGLTLFDNVCNFHFCTQNLFRVLESFLDCSTANLDLNQVRSFLPTGCEAWLSSHDQ